MPQQTRALLALVLLTAGCPPTDPAPQPIQLTSTPLPRCTAPDAPGWQGIAPPPFTHQTTGTLPAGWDPILEAYRREIVAGVGAADLDGDGHVDLVLTQAGGATAFFWGLGDGTFTPSDLPAEATRPDTIDQSVSIVDYDRDGRPDVLIVGFSHVRLLHNEGGRTLRDVTDEVGLVAHDGIGGGAAWADVDGDGDLDLWLGSYIEDERVAAPDSLWIQEESGFVDAWEARRGAVGGPRAALHGVFTDMDDDGDPDLLVVNDFGAEVGYSQLLENVDGVLGDVDRWADTSGPGAVNYPMGAAVVDLDGDGARDLILSDIGSLHLFRRAGTWDFVDVGAAWAPTAPEAGWWIAWSVVPLDPEGDGDMGFLVTYGPLGATDSPIPYEPVQPDRYFARSGDDGAPRFDEVSGAFSPPPPDNTRGVAVADFDEDGVPDLLLGAVDAPPALYRGRCTEPSRLVVVLGDGVLDVRTVGARVSIEAGGRVRSQELRAGGDGTFSASQPALFFGLGSATSVDLITVHWPGGSVGEYTPNCVDCRVVVPLP